MPPVHVFFDFDDTLLRGDSILYWQRFYYRKRPLRRFFQILNWGGLLLHFLRLVDSHNLKRFFLLPLSYEKPEALDALARQFVREELAPRFHLPVVERLWAHHGLGHRVMIISASATFYLKHLKDLLPMADIQGTEMLWPDKGLWRLPRFRDGNLRGANKLTRLKALGFGERAPLSFAYSDHHHDAFLLGFSEFPCAVRPTAKLRRLAGEKGWPVMDWPREAPAWQEKLGKLLMLLFAAGPRSLGMAGTCDPARQAAEAPAFAPAHVRALRDRVAASHPPETRPEVYRTIFGEPRGEPDGAPHGAPPGEPGQEPQGG